MVARVARVVVCAFLVNFSIVSPACSQQLPRAWVIGAYRAGEQSQLLALAEALGWPYEIKPVKLRWQGAWRDLLRATGAYGIDQRQLAAFAPPWPDLVLAAGMRNEPLCRWIRHMSGGRTRIVHVGRPWASPENFDLVIATPQYRLPEHPLVLQNTLTLHRVTRSRMDEALHKHGARLALLPEPRIAVIVGGPSGPYAFGGIAARRLARQAGALARELGGSLMLSSSSRTPPPAFATLCDALDVPHEAYAWRANDPQNPYYAYLALAKRLVVTCDSIAMLSEACATARPVYMFDPGQDRSPQTPSSGAADFSLQSIAYRMLMKFGPQRLSRDVSLVHRHLIEEERAVWLGQPFNGRACESSPDMAHAVTRVHALFAFSSAIWPGHPPGDRPDQRCPPGHSGV